ncbi:TonB-dependent siderophore receptor [Caulobacter hibisci]|uniref:TonB-dependent siderophore receptor n=1 Tax=Caulobacter hibisci TaxID=2035993 RepID=A0ABS0SVQ3_9CAUL|nr:TonB-dependent siderophore receptor [Caulobacter hibisci]MBI1683604.1 TonB-dependent siderophore receptor [Caulobacter hibisci]
MFLKTTLLAGGAFIALASPAFAQTAAQSAPATQQADNTDVDGVVVTGSYTINSRIDTATGLGLTLRETPQSVTVITAQRILDQNLSTIADVVRNTAGVSMVEVDDVRNVFNARGFEIKNYQIDGVPLSWSLAGDSGETVADVSIYDRIEIVRGATGLLTGAGDPSASINLVRKHADSREFKGSVTGSLSSWDRRRLETDVSGAIKDGTIRGRFVAKYEQGDTYFDRQTTEKHVLYGVVEADLTDSTLLRVGASQQVTTTNASFWGSLPSHFTDGTSTNLPISTNTAANWSYWDTTNTNYFANLTHTLANDWTLSFNYNRLINEQDSQLLYLYGVIDRTTGVGLATWPYKSKGETTQDSFDIQLHGDYSLFGREHDFTIGALRSVQKSDVVYYQASGANAFLPATSLYSWDGNFPKPDFATTPTQYTDNETEQSGFFAATRLNVTDALKVVGGARISAWKRSGINGGVQENYSSDNVVVPYVGVLYDLTPTHRLYASYTEIFQPQNYRDISGSVLDPVTGKAYELGLKSAFFGDKLQSTIAVFKIQQDGLGEETSDKVKGNPTEQAYVAVDGAESVGFELEVLGRITQGWNVSANYAQFEVEDATGAKVNTDQPRKSFTVFSTYDFDGALNGLTVGGGVNWRDDIYAVSGASEIDQKAFALVNLMARYKINDSLSVQANVDNLFDETYYTQISYFDQYRYGAPRNYTVALKYAF